MIALARALKIAERVKGVMAPFCEVVEIGGSIRRERAFVSDIDVVVLPKLGREYELRARCKERARLIREGDRLLQLRLENGAQLDVWIARPALDELFTKKASDFGAMLLTYTGSKEHNIYLVERAKGLGRTFKPGHGVFEGDKCIASATEAECFKALDLPFIEPRDRER